MNEILPRGLPALSIKPKNEKADYLYSYYKTELNAVISFRSLDLTKDLDMIHDWVNQSYARRFWQLDGSRDLVKSTYEAILNNPRAHSFIGCIDDLPICQIDVYGVAGEELQRFTGEVNDADCGLHLLMLPTKQLQKGWSYYALKNFQRFYFSFASPRQLFAEPDQCNVYANKLAIDAGFHFMKTIELSNKTANLYSISREKYIK